MWIFRFTYCVFQGHAFIDVTSTSQPYQYCLHCGKIREPMIATVDHRLVKNKTGTAAYYS